MKSKTLKNRKQTKGSRKGLRVIGIVVNRGKLEALKLLKELHRWSETHGISVFDSVDEPSLEWIPKCSLIVCLGGDGTLLAVARRMTKQSVPILGVNLGNLGFLTEIKQKEVFEELDNFFSGRSEIEERLLLSCLAESSARKIRKRFTALNDVVISREGLARLLRLKVQVSGEELTSFSGDGVIVATPTGSTAYSLSAGGAVVHPILSVMMITPICPHASSLRPMVVASHEKIRINLQNAGQGIKALLSADGQENLEIDTTFSVEVTRSDVPLRLVKSSRRGYFEALRENFKFPS